MGKSPKKFKVYCNLCCSLIQYFILFETFSAGVYFSHLVLLVLFDKMKLTSPRNDLITVLKRSSIGVLDDFTCFATNFSNKLQLFVKLDTGSVTVSAVFCPSKS